MLILTISHHLYLTREERYALHEGKRLEIVGVSVPVWADQGLTSELAQEVFCIYDLCPQGNEKLVSPTSSGYRIILPPKPNYMLENTPTDEEWRVMPIEMQNAWYEKNRIPLSSQNLLDITDGGSEGMRFRYKTNYSKTKPAPTFHFVEIKSTETLQETMI